MKSKVLLFLNYLAIAISSCVDLYNDIILPCIHLGEIIKDCIIHKDLTSLANAINQLFSEDVKRSTFLSSLNQAILKYIPEAEKDDQGVVSTGTQIILNATRYLESSPESAWNRDKLIFLIVCQTIRNLHPEETDIADHELETIVQASYTKFKNQSAN